MGLGVVNQKTNLGVHFEPCSVVNMSSEVLQEFYPKFPRHPCCPVCVISHTPISTRVEVLWEAPGGPGVRNDEKVHLIVSNPPYVPTEELKQAAGGRDTRGLSYEPIRALDGGSDGQRFLREIKNAGIPAIVEGIGRSVHSLS